jgi:hypothetical protein
MNDGAPQQLALGPQLSRFLSCVLSTFRQGKRVPKLEPLGRLSREQSDFVEHFG